MFDEIDVDKSKWSAAGRNVIFSIVKKKAGPFWPRLLKDDKKDPSIHVLLMASSLGRLEQVDR